MPFRRDMGQAADIVNERTSSNEWKALFGIAMVVGLFPDLSPDGLYTG